MEHGHLPRLDDRQYRGNCAVHWNMTIEHRRKGWLDEGFHRAFREILVHSNARYRVVCPIYCLMPDHLHLLCVGVASEANQRLMIRHLRRHLSTSLDERGFALQKQAFDRVLRGGERHRRPFEELASYIAANPVRAGLVDVASAYPYSGCMIPGYPELRLWGAEYWEHFWRVYESAWKRDGNASPADDADGT